MKFLQTFLFLCFLITYVVAKCGIQVECPPTQYKDNKTMRCALESDNSACPTCVCEMDQKPNHAPSVTCFVIPQCPPSKYQNDTTVNCTLEPSGKPCPPEECVCKPKTTCDEGKGEEYTKCGSACPLSCKNKDNPPFCIQSCVQGCFCRNGQVRDESGKCVEPEECPADACGKKHEVFKTCGTACPETCSTLAKGTNRFCTRQCVRGCFCKDGYVKNDQGVCVRPRKCPKHACGKHEVFKTCGTACPKTCSTLNKGTDLICTKQCVRGCFCKDGYVKNDQAVCVRPRKCPKPTKPPHCGRKEQFYDCIPACNQTCEAYARKGILACKTTCTPGCYCKKGLYKRKDGKCVKPSRCNTPTKQPENCSKNEVYSTCANPCNDCQTRGKCQFLVCNKGCDCKNGYYRDENRNCIPASRCPVHECGRNEEYKTCGTACEATCSNRFLKALCIDKCVEGCFCKEGFIRNDERTCIEASKCQVGKQPSTVPPVQCGIPKCSCPLANTKPCPSCPKGC